MAASRTTHRSPEPARGENPGVAFGAHRLFERIAVGGVSESFLARGADPALRVVKRLSPVVDGLPDGRRAFLDAMAALRAVRDPRLARVLDVGEVDGAAFAAVAHVPGVDLARVLDRARSRGEGVLPRALACVIAREVARGLEALHGAGLVAGDLSPGQIAVSYDGDVVLLDAGLLPALRADRALERGFLRGKVGYLSPEQVRGLPLDGRSDVFSVGALLSELLTGRPLFDGRGDYHTLELLQRLEIAPPRMVDRTVPQALEAVVLRCLARDPGERFPNATSLAEALDAALDRVGPGTGAPQLAAWLRDAFLDELTRDTARWADLRALPLAPAGAGAPEASGVVATDAQAAGADVAPLRAGAAATAPADVGEGEADAPETRPAEGADVGRSLEDVPPAAPTREGQGEGSPSAEALGERVADASPGAPVVEGEAPGDSLVTPVAGTLPAPGASAAPAAPAPAVAGAADRVPAFGGGAYVARRSEPGPAPGDETPPEAGVDGDGAARAGHRRLAMPADADARGPAVPGDRGGRIVGVLAVAFAIALAVAMLRC